MGKDLYDNSQKVRDFFHNCSDIVQQDLCKLLFDATQEELQKTNNTQIAVTAVSIAVAMVLKERGIEADAVAGFSLGEYAALVLAEVLEQEAVFRMVRERGSIMEKKSRKKEAELSEEAGSPVKLGMTAVLGLHPFKIQELLQAWDIGQVYLSMYNSPAQGVLSGTETARKTAADLLKEHGARRIVPLRVGGAFHTELMAEARAEFEQVVRDIEFRDPQLPVYSNVTGSRVNSGSELKTLYLDQIVNPVKWVQEEEAIWKNETPQRVLEAGPGNVLTGLWKHWKASMDDERIPDAVAVETYEKICSL